MTLQYNRHDRTMPFSLICSALRVKQNILDQNVYFPYCTVNQIKSKMTVKVIIHVGDQS